MMRKFITLAALIILSPILISAGPMGGGHGCDCKDSKDQALVDWTPTAPPAVTAPSQELGEELKEQQIKEEAKAEEKAEEKGEEKEEEKAEKRRAVAKGIYDLMPDVDLIALIKVSDVLSSEFLKPFFEKGQETSVDLLALKAFKEAAIEGDADFILIGFKFTWPKTIKDALVLISTDEFVVRDAIKKEIEGKETGSEIDIEGNSFKEYDGLSLGMFYLGNVDGITSFGTKEILTAFVENYSSKDDAVLPHPSVKDNLKLWPIFSGLPEKCSLCMAAIAPVAGTVNDMLKGEQFKGFWVGPELVDPLGVAIGLGLVDTIGLDFRGYIFDTIDPDVSLSLYLSEDLLKSIKINEIFDAMEGKISRTEPVPLSDVELKKEDMPTLQLLK